MAQNNLHPSEFSRQRIAAVDGMAVTEEIWNRAHDYHRHAQGAHMRHTHGAGILAGLHVHAEEPANPRIIHVSKGIAIDAWGQPIILEESEAYTFSDQTGVLYVVLTYEGESTKSQLPQDDESSAVPYKRSEHEIKAVSDLPPEPYVELARLHRADVRQPLQNAQYRERPVAHEIDLRYRREIGASLQAPSGLPLIELSRGIPQEHWRGWHNLMRELWNLDVHHLWPAHNVTLTDPLESYPMICLAALDDFQVDQRSEQALVRYLQNGGTIYFECCRRSTQRNELAAEQRIETLLKRQGGELASASANHELLRSPHIFTQPPPGFGDKAAPIQIVTGIGRGVAILSKNDYACVWGGERQGGGVLTRTELRETFEWGRNLITFGLNSFSVNSIFKQTNG